MAAATTSAVRPTRMPAFTKPVPTAIRSQKQSTVDIIDIRSAAVEGNIKDDIHALLKPKHGARRLPTLLLYNERGLQLFEQVHLRLEPSY